MTREVAIRNLEMIRIAFVNPATKEQRKLINDTVDMAISALSENKGEWVFDETLDKHYYCSECKSMGVSYWDYCPYCGARMKGGEE